MKTFAQHLQELKVRLGVCFAVIGAGSIVGFMAHKPIEAILQKPLDQTLYYSNPAGGLSFVMQIAFGTGMLIALPVLLYQLVQFARPAVKPVRTKNMIILLACSTVLTALAVVYAYFVSLPAALHFLVNFNSENVKALISVSDYVKFLFAYLAGTVVAFQIPLILFFTNKIKRFPPGGLLNLQRPAIAGAIIFAAIVTPTVDPINQMLVAVPIIALFQVGAFAVFIDNRIHKPVPVFEIKRAAVTVPLVVPLEDEPSVAKAPVFAQAQVSKPVARVVQGVRPVIRPTQRRVIISDVFVPAH